MVIEPLYLNIALIDAYGPLFYLFHDQINYK
jgi:hypothetical protein